MRLGRKLAMIVGITRTEETREHVSPQEAWPSVAAVMPIRNEAETLAEAVDAVLTQDYPGPLEVCLAVGPSHDGTEAVAERLAAADCRVRVVPNPDGGTPAALNAAIAATSGDVVARVDGHALLGPGYLRRAAELLVETGADNVGGIMAAEGVRPFEQAVACAMTSKYGTGDARFHTGGPPGPVDTVYLGVFRRAALERIGGFDETLARAQDAELNHRIRTSGGVVYFHPDLRVAYRPRSSLRALARQYFLYGRWRRVVVRRHPDSLAWRQTVAPAALVAIAGGVALAALRRPVGLLAPAAYAGATLGVSALEGRRLPAAARRWLPLVYATMHLAWALGFLTSPRHLGRPGRS
jgi:succinoglycan biosynthesis protein ExoA